MKHEGIPGTLDSIAKSELLVLSNSQLAQRCAGSTNLVIQEFVRRLEGEAEASSRRPYNHARR